MLGFPVALFVANGFEWYAHKVWLHEYPAKHRNSPFFTHIRHHKRSRLNGFADEGYRESMWKNQEMFNEKTALIGLAAASTVTLPVAPFFTLGLWYSAWNYWSVHSKCHLDPDYARNRIPWHYDHHMNANQDANWCVTRPWFDYIMGTRVFSEAAPAETNPLGITLPNIIEVPLNQLARRLLKKSYRRIDARSVQDKNEQQQGIALPVAGVA